MFPLDCISWYMHVKFIIIRIKYIYFQYIHKPFSSSFPSLFFSPLSLSAFNLNLPRLSFNYLTLASACGSLEIHNKQ